MHKKILATVTLVSAFIFGFPLDAGAATATGSFQVTLTIVGTCSVTSASNLAFGSASTVPADIDISSNIGVQCSNSTPYTVALNAGSGTGATVTGRLLTSGASTIP